MIEKWSANKRDLYNVTEMKRRVEQRLFDDMEDMLQLQFGESKEGREWKKRLSKIKTEERWGDMGSFADDFFRKQFGLPRRKQPLQLPMPLPIGPNVRRADDDVASELSK